MSTRTSYTPPAEASTLTPDLNSLPLELRRLICPTGIAGRMQLQASSSDRWNLGMVTPFFEDASDDSEDSVVSGGSMITVETVETNSSTIIRQEVGIPEVITIPPPSSPTVSPGRSFLKVLRETPPLERKLKRKPPDDCHIIIRWSALVGLVKNNFTCKCGEAIHDLQRRTVGIATEVDFSCKFCKKQGQS